MSVWVMLLVGCDRPVVQDNGATEEVQSMNVSETTEPVVKRYPDNINRSDRVKGAIFGYLAGDALGLGTHWYYNLNELRNDFGDWIDHYQDPKLKGSHSFADISRYRHEQGVRAGDISQTGQLFTLLLESVVATAQYNEADFHHRLDGFFKTLSGESFSGRYTESIIRHMIKRRNEGISWEDRKLASDSDTSDGAQLAVVLALFYDDPETLAVEADNLMQPFFESDFIRSNQVVYALTLQAIMKGVQLEELREYLYKQLKNPVIRSLIGGFDNVHTVVNGAIAWQPDVVRIEPALHVSQVYGMDCQLTHLLPAAYYLMHRFPNNYEQGVLSAVNGGGNNMARAALTGALLGAMNGIQGIPERFVKDLNNSDFYMRLAEKLVSLP
ncbi:ADP-ribosylglycohydrolase family protein [Endozoicomonas montiporae]|uniref:ADP-ribosylglycohydrolase family protein n=1 Tax=Endozoicomonas montiporae TaxID=1027273 RepID=UPI001C9DFAC4|nr:ADP-ribosylglycohydrolase family protein [Endozoicomonas montiporae]